MRILTWNVNGLATTLQYYPWSEKKSFKFLLDSLESDIICFQEVKCQRSKLTKEMALVPGYNAYFSFSKVKLGYSGVVTYVKDTLPQPKRASEGITGILDNSNSVLEHEFDTPAQSLDAEGRCVVLEFANFTLFNIYFPNDSGELRSQFKMDYHYCVQKRIEALLQEGKQVVLVGDVNAAHEEIDHCDPKQSIKDHELNDFKDLPQRRWLDDILDPKGPLVDITRRYHPDRKKMYTCWNTRMNARPANFGTRIDYILLSKSLEEYFQYSDIQADVLGSDHCPVYADLNLTLDKQQAPPEYSSILSSNFPEFVQQKKLSSFFSKTTASVTDSSSSNTSSLSQQASFTVVAPTIPSPQPKRPLTTSQPKIANNGNKKVKIDSFFTKTSNPSSAPTLSLSSPSILNQPDDMQEINALIEEATQKELLGELTPVITATENKQAWSTLFQPSKAVPRCKTHHLPCLEKTVTKKGSNLGRRFYVCAKPMGPEENDKDQVSCNYFLWKTDHKQ